VGSKALDAGAGAPSGRQAPLQHQVHLSEVRQAEAVALYESGAPIKEIAQRFGIHRVTVSEICKRHGVELRSTTRRMTDEQVGIAAHLYREGASLATIGKELGVNASTVWNRLIKAGVEMRPARGK
jgi:transposase-like protein